MTDLHHAAIGRAAAEHKGLVHKLPEGFQTGRRQGHLQRHELTAAEQAINETQHDDGCDYGKSNVEVLPADGSGMNTVVVPVH